MVSNEFLGTTTTYDWITLTQNDATSYSMTVDLSSVTDFTSVAGVHDIAWVYGAY